MKHKNQKSMRYKLKKLLSRKLSSLYGSVVLILLITQYLLPTVFANNCPATDYDCQIAQIQREIDALKPAHEYNKQELAGVRKQVADLSSRITNLSGQLDELALDIAEREQDLAFTEEIFNQKTIVHYKFLRFYDPLVPFVASDDATSTFREISFRQRAVDQNRVDIEGYVDLLIKLKNDKQTLEKNRTSLEGVRSSVVSREDFLEGEVASVETYLAELSGKQEELQALKAGGFQTSIGDTPPTAEPCSGPSGSSNFCSPGFSPAFAAFSFGAPHRTGMSQYGAYGRSKSGQSAESILATYYQGAELNKGYPVPATINVSGYGAIPFEENYLLGIHEVPESWGSSGGFEALKAQAVAARSYALAVTNGGSGTICPTESCQVYKSTLKSGKWKEAVEATRGWVITKGGSPASTYYSSTTGGYTISQWGWTGIKDAPGNWPDTAYEKVSGSPWFYKAWYKSRGGASCGRNNPWLNSSEMADILNAHHVLSGGGGDAGRVSPVDTGCWGGNPYSLSELSSIGGYTSVSGVSVTYSNSGSTQSVNFSTNKGNLSISGDDLKKAFNLRAPGHIGIKSSLYNIEKI